MPPETLPAAEAAGPLPVRLYSTFVRLAGHLQSSFLLALRLTWGWQFFLAGK